MWICSNETSDISLVGLWIEWGRSCITCILRKNALLCISIYLDNFLSWSFQCLLYFYLRILSKFRNIHLRNKFNFSGYKSRTPNIKGRWSSNTKAFKYVQSWTSNYLSQNSHQQSNSISSTFYIYWKMDHMYFLSKNILTYISTT